MPLACQSPFQSCRELEELEEQDQEKILSIGRRRHEPMTSGLNLLRPRRHRNIRHGSFFSDDMMEQEEEEEVVEEESEIKKRGDAAEPAVMVSAGGGSKIVGVDRGWLQLGISDGGRRDYKDDRSASSSRRSTRPEHDLLGGGSGAGCKLPLVGFPTSAPTPWLPGVAGCHHRWEYQRPSSSARPSPSSSAWGKPPPATASLTSYGDIRVVSLPRRTQTPGLWLVLQAAQEQKKEPFLPQIPKSYLRIKDGRMTIRLMMKYLANKLVLEDESEVEISCRDQQLSPSMTLIFVRDNIWCSSPEAVAEQQQQSDSSTTNKYVMNLLYSRSRRSNGS